MSVFCFDGGRWMGGGVPVCHAGGGDGVARWLRVVFVRSSAWAMGMRSGVKVGSGMCRCVLTAGVGELLWKDVGL